jgi:hypothetical protein
MTAIYTYRIDVFTTEPPDITGYDVDATDGEIGKVDEATYETNGSYLVVDTGFWIFGKKRMIPASVVDRVDIKGRRVHVRMTKDEIKSAPDYDADEHQRDESGYRDKVGGYYSRWSS